MGLATKFQLINGWTKAKVMEQLRKYSNGTRALSGGLCAYQTAGGNRCFIGAFIPEGHEALGVMMNVVDVLIEYPDLVERMPFTDGPENGYGPLVNFQLAHDQCEHDDTLEAAQRWLDEHAADPVPT